MAKMQKILDGVKVGALLDELGQHPELWDKYPLRTKAGISPHRECHDIWLRFRDWGEFKDDPALFCNTQHVPVWYPEMDKLPAIKAMVENIAKLVDCDELGGCLVTKIPAGKQVYPHADLGYNCGHYLSKYLLLLQSAPGQAFCFDGEAHQGVAGDLFIFDNRFSHWVDNGSGTDRISLLMSIKQQGQEVAA